jgi:hypothetical protein
MMESCPKASGWLAASSIAIDEEKQKSLSTGIDLHARKALWL